MVTERVQFCVSCSIQTFQSVVLLHSMHGRKGVPVIHIQPTYPSTIYIHVSLSQIDALVSGRSCVSTCNRGFKTLRTNHATIFSGPNASAVMFDAAVCAQNNQACLQEYYTTSTSRFPCVLLIVIVSYKSSSCRVEWAREIQKGFRCNGMRTQQHN